MSTLAQTPMVSIGMGAFNSQRHIRKSVDSLLAQTFTDFELIISDDCSTDGTGAICRDYAARDPRVRYVKQPINLGVNKNYKFLLDQARGKYFMWAEDNDLWMPACVAECVRALTSDSSINFVIPGHKITSRFSPIFDRIYIPRYYFVSDDCPIERVLAYSRMPFGTHKDDMCYALWDRSSISRIVSDIQQSPLNKIVIGGAMNEYALALYKGGVIDRVLWHKTYRYVPPGHRLGPVLGIASRLVRLIKKLGRWTPHHQPNSPDHHPEDWPTPTELLHQTGLVLSLAGLSQTDIQKSIENHKSYLEIA